MSPTTVALQAPGPYVDADAGLAPVGERGYQQLGAHTGHRHRQPGTRFAVWAPNAASVQVIGDFNGWGAEPRPLLPAEDGSGRWAAFVPGAHHGQRYKYRIRSRHTGQTVDKADPYAFRAELPPATASVIWHLAHRWGDDAWMHERTARNALSAPLSIYELHLGSWRRAGDGRTHLDYDTLARELVPYLQWQGFTHVELMPITEHPFYGSWGYQTTGYFAPTARYGEPQGLMRLVDALHQAGIGVILDWVPSHFPNDAHGLACFDGTHLYEHADPRQGVHAEWGSLLFNYGRHEVRDFLVDSALFWLDQYHFDGLRVDGVASMLYLDYGRQPGDWVPNAQGGREHLEAVSFLRTLNIRAYQAHPDVQLIAEESTAWPGVSHPVAPDGHSGGLGFGMKWNLGWMHDTLRHFARDAVHRSHHLDDLTFSLVYAFDEHFVLPLSHDEVVYGKQSLLSKMPGDAWQQCAGLRALYGFMWAHPGKKLLFMGGEWGERQEWQHDGTLDWRLLQQGAHAGIAQWVADLNHCLRATPALHQRDHEPGGFEWACVDAHNSVLSFLRHGLAGTPTLLAVLNLTPVPRHGYRVGVPDAGSWTERLNSDATCYGGSGLGNGGALATEPVAAHGHVHSLALTLPPLSVLYLEAPR